MLTPEVAAAVARLQRAAGQTTDIYKLERIDRALDECLRHPHRTAPAAHQERSALANAAKVIKQRREIRRFASLDQLTQDAIDTLAPASAEPGYDVVDALEWIGTARQLNHGDRAILCLLALGRDAEMLAAEYGDPPVRMRERISRARRAARAARTEEATDWQQTRSRTQRTR